MSPSGTSADSVPRASAWALPWRASLASGRFVLPLVAVLFIVNVLAYYPGSMMNDSVNQYAEAVSGRLTDWHPPIMAWLWSLLRRIHNGPAPFFVLHLAAFWGGIGLIADATRRSGRPGVAAAVALAGAFPSFVFENAYVIKDVGMAVSWVAAVGLIYWFRSQGRRMPLAWALLAGLLIVYGALVRTNAVFGLGPLLMYALAPAAWLRNLRLMIATLLIAVVAVPLSQQVNRVLFQPVAREAVNSLFLYDLIGIALHENNPALIEPRATLSLQDLKTCYTPFWWDSFSSWGPCGDKVHRPDHDRATYGEGLAQQWAKTIKEHPMAYTVHRLKHFNSELMFAVPLKHMRLAPEFRTDLPGFKPLEVFSPTNIRMDIVRKNPVVWPVTWVAWGAMLLLFLARAEPLPSVLFARVLVVSALAYSGAYLLIGVATDIRYHYWSMLASVLATLVVWPQLAQGWRSRSKPLIAALAVVAMVVITGLATRAFDFQAWTA